MAFKLSRMVPWTHIKRKLPTLFLASCVCLLFLFIANVYYDSQLEKSSDDSGLASFGGIAKGAHRRHRKRLKHFDDEEELVCHMPKLQLENDANRAAFYNMPPLECKHANLFATSHGELSINRTTLGEEKIERCVFRTIHWETDAWHTFGEPIEVTKEPFTVPIKSDFFKVECYLHRDEKQEENIAADFQEEKDTNNAENKPADSPQNVEQKVSKDEKTENIPRPNPYGSVGLPDPGLVKGNQNAGQKLRKLLQDDGGDGEVGEDVGVGEDGGDEKAVEEQEVEGLEQQQMYDDEDQRYNNYQNYFLPDFEQFFAKVNPRSDILERTKSTKPSENSLQMNLFIFALDSMSHLSYQRKLPKTYSFLKKNMEAVVLNGYNIVGDATTAAIIPIMTGKTELELPEVRIGHTGATFVDRFPFIWNKFEQQGYVTMYAEDQPSLGTFQLRLHGFEQEPVDHYIRPFWQAAHDSYLYSDSTRYCLGHQPLYKYTLDYVEDYFEKYPKTPKFAFAFLGEYSHHDNNPAEYVDADLQALLERLNQKGHLNNTLLIVMGDHGARYSAVRGTIQGKLEERLPMMSLTFPKWFKSKYPQLFNNLKVNVDRLTTPFDLHETFKDILDIQRATKPVKHSDRGISLLHEIPLNRTCQSAHIDMHWCTCMKYQEVDITHRLVKEGAHVMVENINQMIQDHHDLCVELTLKEIVDAKMVIPNEKVIRYLRSSDKDNRVANFSKNLELDLAHYQIILKTKPNDGLYEGTVMYNVNNRDWKLTTEISRINMYGDQPHCIVNSFPEIRKYCLCKQPKETQSSKKSKSSFYKSKQKIEQ